MPSQIRVAIQNLLIWHKSCVSCRHTIQISTVPHKYWSSVTRVRHSINITNGTAGLFIRDAGCAPRNREKKEEASERRSRTLSLSLSPSSSVPDPESRSQHADDDGAREAAAAGRLDPDGASVPVAAPAPAAPPPPPRGVPRRRAVAEPPGARPPPPGPAPSPGPPLHRAPRVVPVLPLLQAAAAAAARLRRGRQVDVGAQPPAPGAPLPRVRARPGLLRRALPLRLAAPVRGLPGALRRRGHAPPRRAPVRCRRDQLRGVRRVPDGRRRGAGPRREGRRHDQRRRGRARGNEGHGRQGGARSRGGAAAQDRRGAALPRATIHAPTAAVDARLRARRLHPAHVRESKEREDRIAAGTTQERSWHGSPPDSYPGNLDHLGRQRPGVPCRSWSQAAQASGRKIQARDRQGRRARAAAGGSRPSEPAHQVVPPGRTRRAGLWRGPEMIRPSVASVVCTILSSDKNVTVIKRI